VISFELPHMRIESQNVGLRASTSPKHVAAMRRRRFALVGKVKRQRMAANWALLSASTPLDRMRLLEAERVVITLTRIAPGTLDREDNLTAGFKAVRDGVADGLMRDDRDGRLRWHYEQVKRGRGIYGVKVQLEAMSVDAYAKRLAARERAA
jgi:hypothetical protein